MLDTFYLNQIPNDEGRFIEDIWLYTNDQLESSHTYIQWLFPNKEPSFINRNAPLLDDQRIMKFRSSPILLNRVDASFQIMMSFFDIDNNHPWFLTKNNHNFLRITRILNTLVAFGMQKQADRLFARLIQIYWAADNNRLICPITMEYWRQAYRGM
jgi:hypothetical protein